VGVLEQYLAGLGKPDTWPAADQLTSDFLLQGSDALAQGRLRNAQLRGCPREVKRLGQHAKMPEMTERGHIFSLWTAEDQYIGQIAPAIPSLDR
jgi:hypothetical protein